MAVDPVCGQQVNARTSKEKVEYAGETYYFDKPECKRRFVEEPDMFTGDPGMGQRANRDG